MRMPPEDTAFLNARRLRRPMNAIERILSIFEEIQRTGAERILCAAIHAFGPWLIAIRLTAHHVLRRCPVRPLLFVLNGRGAAEFQSGFADADAIPQGFAVLHHKIEETFVRIDDNRSWRLRGGVSHQLPKILRMPLRDLAGVHLDLLTPTASMSLDLT